MQAALEDTISGSVGQRDVLAASLALNLTYRCLKARLATSESLCKLLEIQIPGPHSSGFCFSRCVWGNPGIYVFNPLAGEFDVQPDWRTTELAYPPRLRDECTGTEKSPMPWAHPHQAV